MHTMLASCLTGGTPRGKSSRAAWPGELIAAGVAGHSPHASTRSLSIEWRAALHPRVHCITRDLRHVHSRSALLAFLLLLLLLLLLLIVLFQVLSLLTVIVPGCHGLRRSFNKLLIGLHWPIFVWVIERASSPSHFIVSTSPSPSPSPSPSLPL
jgi:hypothetical protein